MLSVEVIMNRSNCFKLLAACFYEPDRKMFVEERVIDNLQSLLSFAAPAAAEAAYEMNEALLNSTQEQLSVDYAALFVGPFELLAAPYGSVYLEQKRQVLGDTTKAVHRYYEDGGLSLDIHEPADHIVIELEFLHNLSFRQAQAIQVGDEKENSRLEDLQKRFFNQFMGWLPPFCSRLEAGAQTRYFQALSRCLDHFYDACRLDYWPGIAGKN